ncbi:MULTISPECIES: DNA polymerase III subunit gamma/tau C-terminal domain-containing protein [unclassified Gilliamella]|uniref:DNA polymerase III subunit gamma/tau C-terminal domain-containing protein n=2 Tax=Gilliamella TaxID=1193503 RepID=UPI0013272AC1|nr:MULTISPECIES: DNA polymerase III subunit gamma/tau C-terminal domain-containing protein [unclassified Gilliamella]MWP48683.1 hypothetical protein [Gilliamella sp. Lep-s35]MWP49063.1 hypothetical protein [Gilliamella sp. Lep-s35]MWP76886.1 hypothetical protein [Gilliamella sp. Lep-s21]MWP76954.1 hypothetical protein [Gilliamella sp. Lep-s21]
MPKAVDAVVPPTVLQPQSQTQTQTQHQAQAQAQAIEQTNVSKQAEGNKSVNSQTQISHVTTPVQATKAPQVSQLEHNAVNHSDPVKSSSLEAKQSALSSPLSGSEQSQNSSKPVSDKSSVASRKVEKMAKSGNDDLAIPDDVSTVTKSILEMRMQLMKEEQNPKKPKTVEAKVAQPKSPVINASLERIKQNSVPVESINTDNSDSHADNDSDNSNEKEEITAENYQWQASGLIPMKEEIVVDTKAFRESLNGEKTPEMTKKLIAEMAQKDAWCAEIEQLDLSPLIKQIFVNSAVEQTDNETIVLHLRSNVKHLINSVSNVIKVKKALCKHRNQELDVNIIIDDDLNYKTPIEMREELYQEKLAQAKITIAEDPKVATICRYFDAKIDEASVRPMTIFCIICELNCFKIANIGTIKSLKMSLKLSQLHESIWLLSPKIFDLLVKS